MDKHMEDHKRDLFDMELFGLLIRRERTKAGFGTAESFAKKIVSVTMLPISKDVIYRIESGKQSPTLEQAMAINLTLNKRLLEGLPIEMCVGSLWKGIDEEGLVEEMDRLTGGEYSISKAMGDISF